MKKATGDKTSKREMMLTMPMPKLIPLMSVPTIVSMLITAVYNLADTYFVSSLGTAATAAVGVNSSIDQFISMAGTFISFGTASFVSRKLGKGEDDSAEKAMNSAFFTCLAIGIIFMIFGLIFRAPLVRVLGATPDSMEYSIQYANWIFLGLPFMASSFVLNQSLRAEGHAVYSMIGMGLGGLLNIVLDPLFIFVFHQGVAGAGQATALCKVISFLLLLFPYFRGNTILHITVHQVHFEKSTILEVMSVGSSSLLRTSMALAAGVITNNIAGGFSTAALAAISVTNRIMMFPFNIFLGLGMGFQPVAGFNWGAGRFDRVKKGFWFAIWFSAACAILIAVLVIGFASPLIHLFNSQNDIEMLRIGRLCLTSQAAALVFHAATMIINMLFAGCGKAGKAMFISLSRQGICFIPTVFLLSRFFGVEGLAVSQAIADVISIGIAIPLVWSFIRELNQKAAGLNPEKRSTRAQMITEPHGMRSSN